MCSEKNQGGHVKPKVENKDTKIADLIIRILPFPNPLHTPKQIGKKFARIEPNIAGKNC
jgi:hypothetical protein